MVLLGTVKDNVIKDNLEVLFFTYRDVATTKQYVKKYSDEIGNLELEQ